MIQELKVKVQELTTSNRELTEIKEKAKYARKYFEYGEILTYFSFI